MLRYRLYFQRTGIHGAQIVLLLLRLLCSPPLDTPFSKLYIRRQIIENIASVWAESSFTCGSLFIFLYLLSLWSYHSPLHSEWSYFHGTSVGGWFTIRDPRSVCEGIFPLLEQSSLNFGLLIEQPPYFYWVLDCYVLLVCVLGSCYSAPSSQAHLSCLLPSLSLWLSPFPLCRAGQWRCLFWGMNCELFSRSWGSPFPSCEIIHREP